MRAPVPTRSGRPAGTSLPSTHPNDAHHDEVKKRRDPTCTKVHEHTGAETRIPAATTSSRGNPLGPAVAAKPIPCFGPPSLDIYDRRPVNVSQTSPTK